MAITVTPLWIEGLATHASQQYRRFLEALCSFKEGIVSSGDFAVTTNNNMTVNVAAGLGVVNGSEDSKQGFYFVQNDATEIVSVDAAHATLNRYDMVVIRIRDNFYATGPTNDATFYVVKGTPASSPAEPTIPANCFVLARLTVTANDTSIAAGDILDRRTTTTSQSGRFGLKGAFRPVTSATRPTANLEGYGDFIVETDTGLLLAYGTAWHAIGALDQGKIASAVVAANESTTSTSYVDLATAGPAVSVLTGSKALVILSSQISITSADAFMGVAVSGATTIAASSNGSIYASGTQNSTYAHQILITSLNPGVNTFTAKYKVGSGTANFITRYITVIPQA